jgi:regulator of sirC expression with transglutaminase-like and TPR domain
MHTYMKATSEIHALLQLLDDPDDVVYDTISNKIISFGKPIVPNLEQQLLQTIDPIQVQKITDLICKLNFEDVKLEFTNWVRSDQHNLTEVLLILNNFQFNQTYETETRKFIKTIYQSAWLEMNHYLSPMEQVNVLSSVLYNMYKLNGSPDKISSANHFFVHHIVEYKSGNQLSLNILYVILCQLLNIPILPVDIPGQFLLAYFDTVYNYLNPQQLPEEKILLYIDANNGMVYTQSDVEAYLKKSNIDLNIANDLKAISNKELIKIFLKQLLKCYKSELLITTKEKYILELIAVIENAE